MGSITTGIGLISGIDTASLIDALITLASGPKFNLQTRLAVLQSQQTALMGVLGQLKVRVLADSETGPVAPAATS